MNNLKKLSLSIVVFIAFSFSYVNIHTTDIVGVYGTEKSFQITLKDDHTFNYYELKENGKLIETDGKWEVKDEKIHLISSNSKQKIKYDWELDVKAQTIQYKKHLRIITLVKHCK